MSRIQRALRLRAIALTALCTLVVAGCSAAPPAAPTPAPTQLTVTSLDQAQLSQLSTTCELEDEAAEYLTSFPNDEKLVRRFESVLNSSSVPDLEYICWSLRRAIEPVADDGSEEPPSSSTVLKGTFSYTDRDGYEIGISYLITIQPNVSSNIVNEKPGFATVVAPSTTSVSVKNLTPGRTFELRSNAFKLSIGLGYPSESPICNGYPKLLGECVFLVRTTFDFRGGLAADYFDIGSGETLEMETFSGSSVEESDRVAPGITIAAVPEANVEALVAGLSAPSHVYIFGQGPQLSNAPCRGSSVDNSLTAFILGSTPSLDCG